MAATREKGLASMRVAVKRANVKENTHAVVCFDDAVAVVPWKHVTVVESTDSREKCNVMWSDGLSYDGIVIFKGTKDDCLLREKKELDKEEDNDVSEKENAIPSQVKEDKLKPVKKRKKLQKVGTEKEQNESEEDVTPPSMPLKKKKKVVKQKLQQPDNTKPAKKKASVVKQTKNKELAEFIVHVSSSPPQSPTSKLPFQNATNATRNEVVRNIADEVKGCEGLNDASCGSTDIAAIDISMSTSDDEDGDVHIKTFSIPMNDGSSPRRSESPIHGYNGVQDDLCIQVDKMRDEIQHLIDEQEDRFDEVFTRLDAIERQIKLLFTSGVASALASPTVQHFSTLAQQHQLTVQTPCNQPPINQPPINQPPINQPSINWPPINQPPINQPPINQPSINWPPINQPPINQPPVNQPPVNRPPINQPVADNVGTNGENSTEELIPSNILIKMLVKYKTRRSLAAALVTELVDVDTRVRSNVRGKSKKDQLDPKIISYVKRKCFEQYPSKGDFKKEWDDCVISIDNQARDIKRRLNSQK